MRGVYYNEFDKKKAAWLRHLIEEGAIAHGIVDERSIHEVQAEDLRGFAQCHFFAGVGIWSFALRRAGWPDDRRAWTGSCPCGPFSKAGLRKGFADPRHLWPEWFRLIGECGPDRIFGEQSDEADAWVDLVASDLEGKNYAFGSPDIPAAGFGGAHIRQRFFWVADANDAEWWADRAPWHDGHWPATGRVKSDGHAGDGREGLWVGDAGSVAGQWLTGGLPGAEAAIGRPRGSDGRFTNRPSNAGGDVGLGDAWRWGSQRRPFERSEGTATFRGVATGASDAEWLWCRDQVWRPVEPGSCPLADEAPARVGRLCGYGDAIDAEAAAEFVAAYMDAAPARAAA